MVPGMSERERLAVAVQRLEWLADAALASARSSDGRRLRTRSSTAAPWAPSHYRGDASRSHGARSIGIRGRLPPLRRQEEARCVPTSRRIYQPC
jgi:hypothetical protein